MAALLGPVMVLIFCLSQAFRDVYFANIFQDLSANQSRLGISWSVTTAMPGTATGSCQRLTHIWSSI